MVVRSASLVPSLKRYVLEMRFKPMPRYEQGAVVHDEPRSARSSRSSVVVSSPRKRSSVGTLFVQPRVDTRTQQNVLLDDVLGPWFSVVCWNKNPHALLGAEAFARWKALGATFVAVRPVCQLFWTGQDDPDVVIAGDRTGALKSWFDTQAESVLFLRPDRSVAGACIAQLAPELSSSLFDVLCLTSGGNGATGPLLYVPQSAAESAGTVARAP